jgi:hypothetical protein
MGSYRPPSSERRSRDVRNDAVGPPAGLDGPEVLRLTELERPVPLPTEVLVRVRAVGVNPVEAVIRSGQFPLLQATLGLAEAPKAHELLESGSVTGKIALMI